MSDNAKARAASINRTGSVKDISDAQLLDRAVSYLSRHARRQPAWARVGDVFALGSTYSAQLCQRFGICPDSGKRIDPKSIPEPPAPLDVAMDSKRLDFIQSNRVALVPEFEGPWDAEIYGEDGIVSSVHSGTTPRQAIDAAIAELERRA